jgi:hypothetical protein
MTHSVSEIRLAVDRSGYIAKARLLTLRIRCVGSAVDVGKASSCALDGVEQCRIIDVTRCGDDKGHPRNRPFQHASTLHLQREDYQLVELH